MLNFQDKLIMVTGASSGIGRATAILLSQLGAKLILVARNEEALSDTFSKLNDTCHGIEVFDLANVDAISGWMKEIAAKYGPIEGLVHSAGAHSLKPLPLLNHEHLQQITTVNVFAAIGLLKGLRQKTVRGNSPSAVLLSSVVGTVGQPGIAAYASTKGALLAVMRSLALELAPEGIRVNCISPGVVKTDMTNKSLKQVGDDYFQRIVSDHPLGLGEPEDVANAVAFLLSDAARWVTGSNMMVDGGYTTK